jgi:hypothetical protein
VAEKVAMRDEVETTLSALTLPNSYRAAGALALVYADQLDSAAAAEHAADAVLRAARRADADEDTIESIQALRSKLSARTAIATIGPRLAELLGRLLATPKDAGASTPANTNPAPKAAKAGALTVLRGGKTG